MINILPFKQSDSSRCGPASIKMVLYYYGIDATENEIAERCKWSYELGCTNDDMKSAIESYGLQCEMYRDSSLQDLEYWTTYHIPVIVDWFSPSTGGMPNGHSSVIIGVDEEVHLMDPEVGPRSIPKEDFLRVWFDWEGGNMIEKCSDMVLRLAMIVYPKLK